MVRKEHKQEQKKPKSKVKKRLASAKKSAVTRGTKVEKNESAIVETVPPMLPIVDLLSLVRLGICFFDKDGKVAYFNQHFSEITGLQMEKLAGKKLRKNILWGARGQQDEFQVLFVEARESGKPLMRDRLPVSSREEDQRYWNLNLLPQYEGNAEYSGMYLVIEDVSDIRPRTGIAELMNGFHQAALHHNEMQGLLEGLVDVLKDFSNCYYVKIAIVDKTANHVIKAETGKEPGLWDADQSLSSDLIGRIFSENGNEMPPYRTSGGSIYLDDINQAENSLGGALKDLVVNARNSYGFQSLALIPVKLDNRITGFIQMANKKAGGIPGETLEAVENTADQLKIILDRIGLKDDVRRQRENLLQQMHERGAYLEALSERLKQEISERKKAQEEMRVQRDLAMELNGIVDMEEALQLCLVTAIRVSGADSGGIHIVDRQTGQLTLMCSKGLSDEFVKSTSHYDATSSNAQLVMGIKPIYTHLDDLEPPINGTYKAEGLKGSGIIPISHNEQAIGCLNVASHVYNEIPFNLRSLLEAVTAQIGSVIARIQNRKDLQDSEERYRTLFTRTANPILIADADGSYLDGNDAALAFLECTKDELLAMHVRDTLPPYLNEHWFEKYRDSWEKGGTIERDYYVWGKIKVMEMTLTSLQLGGRRIVFGIGKDITERKRVELALRESEEKYRRDFNNVSDVIYTLDLELRVVDISPSVERLLGFKAGEFIGQQFEELNVLAPESVPVAYENLKTTLSGGHVESTEYQFIAKDGTRKYIEIKGSPLYSGDKIIGTVAVARDITEHKKMEQALIESESRYRSLVESSGAGIAIVNMAGQISFANDALCRMTGYSKEEVLTKQFTDFVHPEDMENTMSLFSEALEVKRLTDYVQFRLVCKDGRVSWFYTNPTKMVINGEIIGFSAILQDITERKNAEEALQLSQDMFRNIVENISELFYIQDKHNNFIYLSPQTEKIVGYTVGELAENWQNLMVDSAANRRAFEIVRKAVQTGERQPPYLFEFYDKDRGIHVFEMNETPLQDSEGRFNGFVGVARDMTELKRAEEKFRDLADLLPQVVFEADTEGVFTYVNRRGYEVFGYVPDEVIGKMNVADVIIPEEREKVLKNYFRVLSGETTEGNEYTVIRKDGSTFNAIVFTNSIVQGDQAVGLRGAFTDISVMKKTENALRESEEKYRSVVENAGEAIYIAQDRTIKFANQRTFEIIYYTKEELFSRPFTDIIHPEDREMVVQRYTKRLQGEETIPIYAFRIIDKDGAVKWLELRANPIQWEGQPATLNFVTDITERKQAEQALKESEERYRLLAENSLDVIWTADMKGELTYVSPSIRYLVGRSAEDIMEMYKRGTLTPDIFGVAEEDGRRFWNGLQTLREDPSRTLTFEFGLKHSDGFISWVEAKMSIMRDQNGQAAGILGIVRDITQQKKMTERLVSTDRLASLGEMAAGLAHEVNNPLTAVMGFAYLLQQNPNIPPEIKNDVDAIYREGKRSAEVIKSFLIFARGQKPERQAVYINDILEGVIRLRHSQMNKENIEVVLNLADDLPAIQGDVSQLQQAFLNVVLNAEYFMYKSHRGGHLSLTSMLEDGKIEVSIGDDGPGIPPEKLNRVFDPFYTTKDVGEGTGLGLSICHGIIREHGGDIYVESSPGKGSTFIVELPVGK